uniref:Reverse transcriptase domain-containing protein n=1 Tax=Strigamia maritima TaxID=126957 RepID=T1ISP4_STRMM
MEIDTGAAATIISKQCFDKYFTSFKLQPTAITMSAYDGHSLSVEGICIVPFTLRGRTLTLPLCVVTSGAVPLLGRDWLLHFGLLAEFAVCANINSVQQMAAVPDAATDATFEQLLIKHAHVFCDEVGCAKSIKVHIDIDPDVNPVFLKAYPVPIAMKEKVEAELHRLQSLNIISPIAASKWATPIMHVKKADGTMKIAGCFNRTVNRAILPNSYPLPLFADVATKLAGGESYSTLDMNSAYNQLELDEESQLVCAINTHIGLFRVNRLFYGISSAPAIFQRVMDQLTANLSYTQPYIDNSCVTGPTRQLHLLNLDKFLS